MTCEFVQITQRVVRRTDISCPLEAWCPMEEKCAFVRSHEYFALLDSEEFAKRLKNLNFTIERTWIPQKKP